jgi:PilZ domain
MGTEQRRHPRVPSYAKALLVGPQVPGYIRDLSRHGCQVAFMQPVTAAVGEEILLRVIAENDPAIPSFDLTIRLRWAKRDSIWYAFGGEIISVNSPEGNEVFEKLVSYYAGANG